MRKEKDQAFELRKMGKSYKEIRDKLRIPKSTLSGWFAEVDWSGEVRDRLRQSAPAAGKVRLAELARVRGEHLAHAYEEAREEAIKEFRALRYNPLFIAGIMLYFGQGDRSSKHLVRLTSTDPDLVKFYVVFLRQICQLPLEKIRASLVIYPDIEEESNRRLWAFASGLPLGNFTKSAVVRGRERKDQLRYGVCSVVVSSSYLKVKILEWVKLLPKELMNRGYYENIGRKRP